MRRDDLNSRAQATDRSARSESRGTRGVSRTEALHIRSYDHQWAYDLDVEIMTEDGESVFQNRYYLLPGHVESEASGIPAGDYAVRVTLDNSHTETLACRIGPSLDHTAVVEVGNGAVALTEGFHG